MAETQALPQFPDVAAGAVPEGTPPGVENAVALGLTREEYALVAEKMEREPTQVELAMFSLMWSEHCSYKHSKKLLGTLPTKGPDLVLGPGENAGAVQAANGWIAAFKVESHNHPSAVEPFQGAATGVGGILRDIFALGARPVAVMDALRFGEPEDSERSRFLLDGAVSGIGHYGNLIGVPNIGGDVYFEGPYETNCLVNAMAIGLVRKETLTLSAAEGVGNVVVLFGASTGRDGIGGASVLASAELGEDDASKRPTVQVGDPFEEKKVMECSLELLERGLIVSLQDLGAAGLTSSASEMASKGEVGLDLDVSLVPLREAGLEPFEVMVSESQERMLCVVEPHMVDEVLAVTEKWEVYGAPIGLVTDSRRFRVFDEGTLVGDMPVPALVDDCPLYDLHPEKPSESLYPAPPKRLADDATPGVVLRTLLGSPNLADRTPLFQQYDQIVQSRTVRRPGEAGAAVLAIPEADASLAPADIAAGALGAAPGAAGQEPGADGPRPAIAASIDGSGRRVAADPYNGTIWNVLECAANLATVGARPLGLTNNLNFGNPEKPAIAWQLTEAIRGLGDACRAMDTPVVGGNVSLYNEGTTGPIYPTPVVGMVGELPDATKTAPLGFARAGDRIAIVGRSRPQLEVSELAKLRGLPIPDGLPAWDIAEARTTIEAVRDAVRRGDLSSATDVAEGGIATAIAESAIAGGIGAQIDAGDGTSDAATEAAWHLLFGEAPGLFVVSGSAEALARLEEHTGVDVIGIVGGDRVQIHVAGVAIDEPVDGLGAVWRGGLAPFFP
ncbi:MAG: phosphoribosylformylglycinamidine synthase subunit PurL [Solirubrobacteraceae bacterium]|nr:phosphoribosylformylglycinamidine synthase subunit PurL [Solirubrobacteraceae bacterium]